MPTKQRRSVVIAAHPDDEILWFSAAIAEASTVVLCFGAPFGRPERAVLRQRAVLELGLASLANLAIPESGVHEMVDWSNPQPTSTGMAISDQAGQVRYDDNFERLITELRPLVATAQDVYTHNPWGEYGHPEHVQVHRAVAFLKEELGFTQWFSNYVAPLSFSFAQKLGATPCWAEKRLVPPDVKLAKRLRRVYERNEVWTWSSRHRWPAQENYYAQPAGDRRSWHTLHGEILLDVSALRWWRRPEAALRRIP